MFHLNHCPHINKLFDRQLQLKMVVSTNSIYIFVYTLHCSWLLLTSTVDCRAWVDVGGHSGTQLVWICGLSPAPLLFFIVLKTLQSFPQLGYIFLKILHSCNINCLFIAFIKGLTALSFQLFFWMKLLLSSLSLELDWRNFMTKNYQFSVLILKSIKRGFSKFRKSQYI